MRRAFARSIVVGTLAATMFTGTALAHECFVISRSDTGDIAAGANSQAWATVGTLDDLFVYIGGLLGLTPLSDAQLAWAVDAAQEAGLPSQLTLFGRLTIAEGTPAMVMHAADGHGIDHLFDWAPVIIGIYQDALTH
jgi:hypothetical protein